MDTGFRIPVERHTPTGRYAPSPTGDLHLGNLRTALLAWQHCRDMGGIFILRIEDTDTPRNVAGSESRILKDLEWLGIDWDEGPDKGGPAAPYRQSERSSFYEEAMHRLAAGGLVYPCRCSRKDLQNAPSAPHGNEGPVYPGHCRPEEPRPLQYDPSKDCSWRYRVDLSPDTSFFDELHGEQRADLRKECGDFVVRRRDGLWAYQLACAVDDGLMGITHVLRGEDLLTSTFRQVSLLQVLGFTIPLYRHVPLVLDPSGQRLSKRDGSESLRKLRQAGLSPEDARKQLLGEHST